VLAQSLDEGDNSHPSSRAFGMQSVVDVPCEAPIGGLLSVDSTRATASRGFERILGSARLLGERVAVHGRRFLAVAGSGGGCVERGWGLECVRSNGEEDGLPDDEPVRA
jgi:hypothetical protein